jgi:hypothetical protein
MNIHMQSDREYDARLEELERELEPALRSIWHSPTPRPGFADQLRRQLGADAATSTSISPRLAFLGRQRAWGALAALVAGGVLVSVGVLFYQPQPASAEAVLGQLQSEAANSVALSGAGGCPPPGGAVQRATTGMLVIGAGVGKSGPVSISSASDLSDKLAGALGVSGDQVRQAMLETMRSLTPATSPPPDPMSAIARNLGVSQEQVCSAFFSDGAQTTIMIGRPDGNAGFSAPPGGPDIGHALNLTTATPDQLAPIAAKLGVSSDKLQAAIRSAVAETASAHLPAPPSQEQIVSTFAHNLGIDEGRVRTAINQVEGNNVFYFAVPLPGR